MGASCSKCGGEPVETGVHYPPQKHKQDIPDPAMYELMKRSCHMTQEQHQLSQLLQQQQAQLNSTSSSSNVRTTTSSSSASASRSHAAQSHASSTTRSVQAAPESAAAAAAAAGQYHLLYKAQKVVRHKETQHQQQQQQNHQQQHHHHSQLVQSSSSSSSATGSKSGSALLPMESWTRTQSTETMHYPTRLLVRRHSPRHYEEGLSGTHIYAVRYPADKPLDLKSLRAAAASSRQEVVQEQHPNNSSSSSRAQRKGTKSAGQSAAAASQEPSNHNTSNKSWPAIAIPMEDGKEQGNVDHLFKPIAMMVSPKRKILDWVTVSDEHSIYIADIGLTAAACDQMVLTTEQVCRGQYAAYTYAKQTLGCREFPCLARVCQPAVHTAVHAIMDFSKNARLALDDREPHMVKYDVTKKERQKLDMHTDKSEWTFLISLSNGCGMDYEGGGTYFECLDATVHVQRGHALVFPGKLRHCGQRICSGLRFLLVGFLVDKTTTATATGGATTSNGGGTTATTAAAGAGAGCASQTAKLAGEDKVQVHANAQVVNIP